MLDQNKRYIVTVKVSIVEDGKWSYKDAGDAEVEFSLFGSMLEVDHFPLAIRFDQLLSAAVDKIPQEDEHNS